MSLELNLDGSFRSTRGASKQRRDQINIEIQRLRDLLPLNTCVKDRLFQLQVMSLACIYIRKHRYLPHIIQTCGKNIYPHPFSTVTPRNCDACKALRGFMFMTTQEGKMLYISENVSEYLGCSVEEIMCQGDSLKDLVDESDYGTVLRELGMGPQSIYSNGFPHESVFVCKMNLTRTAKRQVHYFKFILVQGRYIHSAEYYEAMKAISPSTAKIEPLFAAFCQPLINPENADSLSIGHSNIFNVQFDMDLKIRHVDNSGEEVLQSSLYNSNLYSILHPEDLNEMILNHQRLIRERDANVVSLIRLQNASGHFLWCHSVFLVKNNMEDNNNIIQGTFQVVSEQEAEALRRCQWIYLSSTYQSIKDKDNEFSEVSSPESLCSQMENKVDKPEEICVEIPFKYKYQIPSSMDMNNNNFKLLTPEHSSPESSISSSSRILDFKFDPISQLCPSLLETSLPELGDDLDEFFKQVEQQFPQEGTLKEFKEVKQEMNMLPSIDFMVPEVTVSTVKRKSDFDVFGDSGDFKRRSSWTGLQI